MSMLPLTITSIRRPALAIALALGLAACENETGPAQQGPAAVEVAVMTLASETVPLTEKLPGRTTAYKEAEIRPQVSGIITRRLFEEGSLVKEGQQLYQIDDASYQADLQRAKAELQRAEAAAKVALARLERYQGLAQSKTISAQDLEDASANYQQAKANVAAAKAGVNVAEINLRYTKVYAPISGRIGISHITEGALVTANQSQVLARVTQLDPIYVDMPQSSTQYMQLRSQLADKSGKNSATVKLRVDGMEEDYPHTGLLQSSEVTVDASTGAVQLRALFPNPNQELLPGLFVNAQITLGERQALLVPQRAASRNPDGVLQVWRVQEDNTVQMVSFEAASAVGDHWLVRSGLQAGDRIVVQGALKLRAGAPVVPKPLVAKGLPAQQPAASATVQDAAN